MLEPPLEPVQQFLGDALVDRAPDQELLGAVDFGRLGEHARAAVAHQLVHRPAERRVRSDAGVAVRTAAVGGEDQLRQRLPGPPRLVGPGQELRDGLDRRFDRFPDAARLLNRDDGGPVRRSGDRDVLLLDHHRGLVHLAAEADDDVGGDVRVLRVARQHPLERPVVLAEQHLPAPRLVRDRDDAVDVRVVPPDVLEPLSHELAHARRAVDGGDDGDVVARPDAPVRPLEAVEGAHALGRIVVDGLDVDADLVLLLQLADREVLDVDMIAHVDLRGREADDLAVAPDGLADPRRTPCDLVTGPDVLTNLDPAAVVLDDRSGRDVGLRDHHVVGGIEEDRLLSQRERRHALSPRVRPSSGPATHSKHLSACRAVRERPTNMIDQRVFRNPPDARIPRRTRPGPARLPPLAEKRVTVPAVAHWPTLLSRLSTDCSSAGFAGASPGGGSEGGRSPPLKSVMPPNDTRYPFRSDPALMVNTAGGSVSSWMVV